jgi:hypothetical protein
MRPVPVCPAGRPLACGETATFQVPVTGMGMGNPARGGVSPGKHPCNHRATGPGRGGLMGFPRTAAYGCRREHPVPIGSGPCYGG